MAGQVEDKVSSSDRWKFRDWSGNCADIGKGRSKGRRRGSQRFGR